MYFFIQITVSSAHALASEIGVSEYDIHSPALLSRILCSLSWPQYHLQFLAQRTDSVTLSCVCI